jgi:hypothetical protein
MVAAVVSFHAAWREIRRRRQQPYLWPTFWLMSGVIFLALAVARAADLGGLATEIGREQAMAQGWYNDRRRYQAIAVAAVGAVWVTVVAVALWRIPARRRRYLPAALATFTLMCFIGARLISLHQVDAVLYHREVYGAQIGNAAEMALLLLVVVLTLLPPGRKYVADPAAPEPVLAAPRSSS